MKKTLALVLSLLMLTLPIATVVGFWTPPDEDDPVIPTTPDPIFGVSIENIGGAVFNFTELDWGKCENFTVQVSIFNVTDLYGYEFKLTWTDAWFELLEFDYETYANQMWPDGWLKVAPNETAYTGPPYAKGYHQAISAQAPSEGFDGDHVVAEFIFHFVKDICWPEGFDTGNIRTYDEIMVDSTGIKIDPIGPHLRANWKYIAIQPKIYLVPDEVVNEHYIVNDGTEHLTFTVEVRVANITKMKSLYFKLLWRKQHITRFGEDLWFPIISTNVTTDIEVNDALFPEDNRSLTITAVSDHKMGFKFDLEMDCTYPLIRIKDDWVARITFTEEDPWDGNRQPEYFYNATSKEWYLETAETDIWFEKGYFDVMCPDLNYIYFGEYYEGFTAPYSETYTVTSGWNVSPITENDTLMTVTVTKDCDTGMITFEAELFNDTARDTATIPDYCDGGGFTFDIDCNGFADFQIQMGSSVGWPNINYLYFNETLDTWVSDTMPAGFFASYNWSTKGHAWYLVRFPQEVLAESGPCSECYKFACQFFDMGYTVHRFLLSYPWVDALWQDAHALPLGIWYAYGSWGSSYWYYQTKTPVCYVAIYEDGEFTLKPKPGDLDGDCDVDLTDLMITAGYYGAWAPPKVVKYYDLNKDGKIDIIDVVIVAKHYTG